MVGLGDLPGGEFWSQAWSVSADGSIVVGVSKTDDGDEAFIWDSLNGMRALKDALQRDFGLELTGWRLLVARRVSDDGRVVVGEGLHEGQRPEAWRAVLGPATPPVGPRFIRGDCDGNGVVAGQVTDAVTLLTFNFLGGREPPCLAACDADGDGQVIGQVTDAVYILRYNFLGTLPPVAPFPDCGEGRETGDAELGCEDPPESCP